MSRQSYYDLEWPSGFLAIKEPLELAPEMSIPYISFEAILLTIWSIDVS